MDEMKKRIIVWFKNDLRLSDNPALWHACQDADEIIPFYCFEEQNYIEFEWGFAKTGPIRTQFIKESVSDLQDSLARKGAQLQIYQGSTLKALKAIREEFNANTIYCAEEVTKEELQLVDALISQGFNIEFYWQYNLYPKTELPFPIERIPEVFTSFRKKLEKLARVDKCYPEPLNISCPENLKPSNLEGFNKNSEFDSRAVLPFKGGSKEAWRRLQQYFWEEDRLKDYKQTRNGLIGSGYSSKFSPWLATGSISAREIYWEIKRYENERHKNSSTYWLYFELLWRDFFRFTALREGNKFFKTKEHPRFKKLPQFEAWRKGETGQDFVDANMKELWHTGFMSNRGRQNVASYLVHDLKLPWYLGASWFESQLIDYDVCSNYGNWTYITGIGNDPRPDRKFNVEGQAERYDSDRSFRKLWLS